MADAQELASTDPELQALQEEWSPQWCIWRARHGDDQPGELPTGEFLAAHAGEEAAAERTVMRPTAQELDAVLRWHEGLPGRARTPRQMTLPIMETQQ